MNVAVPARNSVASVLPRSVSLKYLSMASILSGGPDGKGAGPRLDDRSENKLVGGVAHPMPAGRTAMGKLGNRWRRRQRAWKRPGGEGDEPYRAGRCDALAATRAA
jgi:hypothetical protein